MDIQSLAEKHFKMGYRDIKTTSFTEDKVTINCTLKFISDKDGDKVQYDTDKFLSQLPIIGEVEGTTNQAKRANGSVIQNWMLYSIKFDIKTDLDKRVTRPSMRTLLGLE